MVFKQLAGNADMADKKSMLCKNETVDFLNNYKNDLRKLYKWEPPKELLGKYDISACGDPFTGTVKLKRVLSEKVKASGIKAKIEIATDWISGWGGIRNSPETIKAIVKKRSDIKKISSYSFEGISSWSKWISIMHPDDAFIYDARVVYSLNVINYICGGCNGIFPSPPGRNSILNFLDIETLLKVKYIEQNGVKLTHSEVNSLSDIYIPKKVAYSRYIQLLKELGMKLWPEEKDGPYYTEMLLFALADSVIFDCLCDSLQKNSLGHVIRRS